MGREMHLPSPLFPFSILNPFPFSSWFWLGVNSEEKNKNNRRSDLKEERLRSGGNSRVRLEGSVQLKHGLEGTACTSASLFTSVCTLCFRDTTAKKEPRAWIKANVSKQEVTCCKWKAQALHDTTYSSRAYIAYNMETSAAMFCGVSLVQAHKWSSIVLRRSPLAGPILSIDLWEDRCRTNQIWKTKRKKREVQSSAVVPSVLQGTHLGRLA